VAGKGGVGSSTVAAAVSLLAARRGRDVLLVSVDGKPGLGPLLGGTPLTSKDQVLCRLPSGGRVRGRTIPPQQAFGDYLDLRGVGGLLRRAAQAASLDVVAASTPGLEHLLVLGKLKELERTREAELIVVDAPPAGHAAPFLRSASAIRDLVPSGPLRQQADEVSAMLADHERSQAMVVTLPEETPVNEAVELAHDLEHVLGLALAPLVVNGCWPARPGLAMATTTAARQAGVSLTSAQRAALVASSRFGAARLQVQDEQLARLDLELPLPRLHLPRLPTPRLGPAELELLADALDGAVCTPQPDDEP
jgi:arsenite/tail-anchored protein-transporting ATPase